MIANYMLRLFRVYDLPVSGRRWLNFGATLALCLLLAACGGGYRPPVLGPSAGPQPTGTYKVGKPYKIAGRWYTPKEDPYYDEVGVASWYGKKFNGRATANGEVFDMDDFSAAHKTLPMPSYVKVTNLKNGRSLVVRVNDRGPFVSERIIDLSRRAAQELGFLKQGTTRVRVKIVKNPIGENFVVALGTTSSEEYNSVIAAPATAVESRRLPLAAGSTAAPEKDRIQSAALKVGVSNDSRGRGAIPTAPAQPRQTQLYVQAGAFSELVNAHTLRDRLNTMGTVAVAPVQVGETQYYRVRIGPMDTMELAGQTLIKLINNGHPDARIVVDAPIGACQAC